MDITNEKIIEKYIPKFNRIRFDEYSDALMVYNHEDDKLRLELFPNHEGILKIPEEAPIEGFTITHITLTPGANYGVRCLATGQMWLIELLQREKNRTFRCKSCIGDVHIEETTLGFNTLLKEQRDEYYCQKGLQQFLGNNQTLAMLMMGGMKELICSDRRMTCIIKPITPMHEFIGTFVCDASHARLEVHDTTNPQRIRAMVVFNTELYTDNIIIIRQPDWNIKYTIVCDDISNENIQTVTSAFWQFDIKNCITGDTYNNKYATRMEMLDRALQKKCMGE